MRAPTRIPWGGSTQQSYTCPEPVLQQQMAKSEVHNDGVHRPFEMPKGPIQRSSPTRSCALAEFRPQTSRGMCGSIHLNPEFVHLQPVGILENEMREPNCTYDLLNKKVPPKLRATHILGMLGFLAQYDSGLGNITLMNNMLVSQGAL